MTLPPRIEWIPIATLKRVRIDFTSALITVVAEILLQLNFRRICVPNEATTGTSQLGNLALPIRFLEHLASCFALWAEN
jgi:hypothetical protein